MKLYHGTDKFGLSETQKQGYLLHKRANILFPSMSPCTYLATTIKEARQYGDIVLEVDYDPNENPKMNNYNPDSWQVRVYEPIYKFEIT